MGAITPGKVAAELNDAARDVLLKLIKEPRRGDYLAHYEIRGLRDAGLIAPRGYGWRPTAFALDVADEIRKSRGTQLV